MSHYLGTVVGVQVYRNDVVVVRSGAAPLRKEPVRSVITEFSYESRQRLAFVAANTDAVFTTMITLTYPSMFPSDGLKVRGDRHAFLKWLRRRFDKSQQLRSALLYLWWLEFQERGAPHLHLVTTFLWPTTRAAVAALRADVAEAWYNIVGSGDPKHLRAGTRTERIRKPHGACRYAVKYALKMRQKLVPAGYRNVGRFWACSRAVTPVAIATHQCTEDDVRGRLEGWAWEPSDTKKLHRVLYGVADRFVETSDRMIHSVLISE